MNTENNQLKEGFFLKWIISNGFGWLVGFIGSFILSHLVVNVFYPKETNLIVGLCLGAGVGYAQWFVLKGMFKIRSMWGLASTICIGIPFIAFEIMNEKGYDTSSFHGDYAFLYRLIFGLIIGFVIGLLQMQLLKPYFKNSASWIAGSTIGWGICFLASSVPMPYAMLGVLLGGVLLGFITGYTIVLMNKTSNKL